VTTPPGAPAQTAAEDDTARTTAALALGDDALVLSHRLGEWAGNAPVLEEEVALANIALDLLGQARVLLSTAGDEDELAFLREERAFRNLQLVEQPNGDFAHTIVRQLYFSTYQHLLHAELAAGDGPFAPLAGKAVKEVAYHRDHAAQWTVRLGDGTDESHRRMRAALERIWPLVGELFTAHEIEERLARSGVAADPAGLRAEFDAVLDQVLTAATLARPADVPPDPDGRRGLHTDALGPLLAELQSVARAHPEATW
jgi:ring-1,2-phenylacetyl-CoA epoxidase subunit PaaC